MNDDMLNDRTRFAFEDDGELDAMLRVWHEENAATARASRDTLIARAAARGRAGARPRSGEPCAAQESLETYPLRIGQPTSRAARLSFFRGTTFRAAASLTVVAILALFFLPRGTNRADASHIVQIPNGGALNAYSITGELVGPCPLEHTHVDIEVTGPFSRITVTQQYLNPYESKIEAVYTFPLSHRAAVDRMTMTIDGERVIEGEVKEREEARQIYEQAKAANHVAALLEQERPNIFTQNVANIEPGASIDIEISYIETVDRIDGVYSLAFPMTVAPRYIPGYGYPRDPRGTRLPEGLTPREGVILRGPASFERIIIEVDLDEVGNPIPQFGAMATRSLGLAPHLQRIIDSAIPISEEGLWEWRWRPENQAHFQTLPDLSFFVHYPGEDGAELGQVSGDGVGHIAGRWFWFDREILKTLDLEPHVEHRTPDNDRRTSNGTGRGFAADTTEVPDASRITPVPVHPTTRAGHDISLSVRIDTGGPAITSIDSELHEIAVRKDAASSRLQLELRNENEIPNRDFVLNWTIDDSEIHESAFVHADEDFENEGGFFTLMLAPPARVEPGGLRPRELIFVMDISGSMKGEPLAKSQSVLTRAIDAMRPGDTFNIITFANEANVLWEAPRPNTNENRAEALAFINSRAGDGGTEIMKAINLALVQPAREREGADGAADDQQVRFLTGAALMETPPDGREVSIIVPGNRFLLGAQPSDFVNTWDCISFGDNGIINIRGPFDFQGLDENRTWKLTGRWISDDGRPWLDVTAIAIAEGDAALIAQHAVHPMRIAIFLTDGEVGNDMAVIDAVKANARTTRVFALGVGNSVNRYLLANMAHAGRGEVEFVTQESDRGDAVDRLVQRIDAPVLTDIELEFSDGLEVTDVLPLTPGGLIPDVYDNRPITIHGRFAKPASGTLMIRGMTGAGPWEREVEVDFSEAQTAHDVTKTLWARAKIDELTNEDLTGVQLGTLPPDQKKRIVDLAVDFGLMSQFTSFVAVEKARVTIDGESRLVTIPIELPSDADWSGYFCEGGHRVRDEVVEALVEDVYYSTRVNAIHVPEDLMVSPPAVDTGVLESLSVQDLKAEMDEMMLHRRRADLERHVNLLESQSRGEWLTEEKAVEIQRLVEGVLADAAERELHEQSGLSLEAADSSRHLELNGSILKIDLAAPSDNEASDALGRVLVSGNTITRDKVILHEARGLQPNQPLAEGAVERTLDLLYDRRLDGDGDTYGLGLYHVRTGNGPDAAGDDMMRSQLQLPFGDPAESGYYRYTPTTTPVLKQLDGTNFVDGQHFYVVENATIQPHSFGVPAGIDAYALGDVTVSGQLDGVVVGQAFTLSTATATPTETGEEFLPSSASDMAVSAENARLVFEEALNLSEAELQEESMNPAATAAVSGSEARDADAQNRRRPIDIVAEQVDRAAELARMIERTREEQETAGDEGDESHDAERGATPGLSPLLTILDPRDPSNARFYFERAATLIVDLAKADHFEQASLMATWLVELDDTFEIAGEIKTILDDQTLTNEEKVGRLEPLAQRAKDAIGNAIRAMIVQKEVERRVSVELLEMMTGATPRAAADALRVSVLVERADEATVSALRRAGLLVEDTAARASLVVGSAAMADIPRIALTDGVRRIELVQ